MTGRKVREKRSKSPQKTRTDKDRKSRGSSSKHGGAKKKDRSGQSSTYRDHSSDRGRASSSIGGGSLESPSNGFFQFPESTSFKKSFSPSSSKDTPKDRFEFIRKKAAAIEKKEKQNRSKYGKKTDSSGEGSDASEDSESSGESESDGDSESSGKSNSSDDSESDSDSDDMENGDNPRNTTRYSRTLGASGGTKAKKNPLEKQTRIGNRKKDRQLARELSKPLLTSEKYEWQFFDQSWITYGHANLAGVQPSETAFTSDDIEAFFSSRYPAQRYMLIDNKYHTYKLDFKEMTQTNLSTSNKRDIRRVKRSANSSGSSGMHLGVQAYNRPRPNIPGNMGHGANHGKRFWQFKDETGAWITYGQASLAGGPSSGTTTSSDDIETFRMRCPDATTMSIKSSVHNYILNFQTMTQTNTTTKNIRQIRCVPFSALNESVFTGVNVYPSGSPNFHGAVRSLFVWQFQDGNDVWTTYGLATNVTSDDIEQYFIDQQGQGQMPITSSRSQYILDFDRMTQTNIKSQYQRKVRRVPKQMVGL